jgi:hypothetical protein
MAYWIFHSVDHTYKLPEALKEAPRHGNVLSFRVSRYAAEITPGDTVYVCFGGPIKRSPGLYATATVLTLPDTIEPKAWERRYEAEPFPPAERGVWLKIEQLLVPPVPRGAIYRELPEHQFVKTHGNGTNFRLTPEQASTFERLIAAPRALGDPAPSGNRSRSARLAAPK